MAEYGGRAIPGISFKLGSSHADLSQMKGDLQAIKDIMRQLQDEAKRTQESINAVGKARPTATKASTDPAYEAAVAQRRAAQRQETVRRANDPEEQEYARKMAETRQTRVRAAITPPSDTERQYQEIVARDRQKAMEETIKRGTTKDTSLLARGMNALSWSPFMPQSTYMMQMALGEMGLGLSMPLVAAGMGIAGLGVGALGINAFATQANRTGQQTIAATGAPPFKPGTYVTGAGEAALLEQRAGQLHLTQPQTQEAVSGLAAGGRSGQQAFGQSLDQVDVLVNAFGMSVQDAANFVTTLGIDYRQTTDQTTAAIASLGKAAGDTGQPLASLGQIMQSLPTLAGDLANNPNQVGPVASMLRALGGSTQGGIALGTITSATGAQALSIAAQMGVSDQQFHAMQQSGPGLQKIADFAIQTAQSAMRQSGGAFDQALIQTNALLGANLDPATFTRVLSLPANAPADAYNAALAGAPAPGSVNAMIAAGNLVGAAGTAVPWNAKDVALNAANVYLTGAVAGAQSAVGAAGGPGAALGGVMSGLGRFLFGPSDLSAGLGIGVPVPGIGVPTPGGGGSTGGVQRHELAVTVDVRQNGASIGSTLAPINVSIQNGQPSQQYQAYVPATMRGPQYR